MQQIKAFFVTFLSALCVVLVSFAGLYWLVSPSAAPADTDQSGVPVINADSGDVKTTLVALDLTDSRFFFLLKLDAINKRAAFVSLPADRYMPKAGRTLSQSLDYAGIMQCVEDLCAQLEKDIDYHLLLDGESLAQLAENMGEIPLAEFAHLLPENLAPFAQYTANTSTLVQTVLPYAQLLDNSAGRSFLTEAGMYLIKNNMSNIQNYVLPQIKSSFSYLNTNIGTQQAARLDRIFTLLARADVQYRTLAADADTPDGEITEIL